MIEHNDICSLREKIARLEEKIIASERALDVARSSVSRASIVSVITIIVSVISIILEWKH